MVTLLIIADDFTGALDTGVKFADKGAAVRVVTDYNYEFSKTDAKVQVLVMDAETRHISGDEAYERIFNIVKRAKKAKIPHIYKKTDSALRGNIGSELTAALDASGAEVLHFLPAFPKMGRITRGGTQYIDGIPVHESVFGKDPFEPVLHSYIPDIIREQSDVLVNVVSEIKAVAAHPTIAVYNVQTDEEMELLAKKIAQQEDSAVIAGCAGMAETLPGLLKLTGQPSGIPEFEDKFLVVCGSVNPITKAQLDYAEQHGFKRIRLTPQQKLELGYFKTGVGSAMLRELTEQCRREPLCILDTNDAPDEPNTLDYARSHGIELEELRVRISTTLGYLVRSIVDGGVDSTMLITGGDSLLGFMNQVQVYEMTPICELAPGTVLSQFEINGKTYEVISKSGGFGGKRLMVELAGKIMGEKKEIVLC